MHRALILAGLLVIGSAAGCQDVPQETTPRPDGPDVTEVDRRLPSVPAVRVLVGEPGETVTVSVLGPYVWRLAGSHQVLASGARLADATLTASETGIAAGGTTFPAGRLELVPETDGSLLVDRSAGDGAQRRAYRGLLRVQKRADGTLALVNVVDLEWYVASVTSGEMWSAFPAAAQRAQAVAARTYALYHMKRAAPDAAFDLYDSTRSQVYNGRNQETTVSTEAARFTRGIVVTYQGKLFCAYFSACCGGQTSDARELRAFRKDAVPTLSSVPCPWCRHPKNTRFAWQTQFTRQELGDMLAKYFASRGVTIGRLAELEVASRHSCGRVNRLRVTHSGGSIQLAADLFRQQAGGYGRIRSTRFDLVRTDDTFEVAGTGWGHGVGLCQWGARGMAEAGKDCVEILKHYYVGSGLAMVY